MDARFNEIKITEEILKTLQQFNVPDVIINIIENYNVPSPYLFKYSWCNKFSLPIKRHVFINHPTHLYVYMTTNKFSCTITTIAIEEMKVVVVSIVFKTLEPQPLVVTLVTTGDSLLLDHVKALSKHSLYCKSKVTVFFQRNYGGWKYFDHMISNTSQTESLYDLQNGGWKYFDHMISNTSQTESLYDLQRLFMKECFMFAEQFIGTEECYIHGLTIRKELMNLKIDEIPSKTDPFKDETLYCLACNMYLFKLLMMSKAKILTSKITAET